MTLGIERLEMHSLAEMLATVKSSAAETMWEERERARYRSEFERAAQQLGVSVDRVRLCVSCHDESQWMSGIHFHAVELIMVNDYETGEMLVGGGAS